MIDLARWGRRLCAALMVLPAVGQAQDLRLPLNRGLSDLTLFTLSRTEPRVSPLGRVLLRHQGFAYDPAGPTMQPLSSGQSLSPTLRHDPNVNGGIPSERITLGGLPFTVASDSQAKETVLAGLRYTRWDTFAYAPGARLRLSHSYAAEADPLHGYHHATLSARICAEQPVAEWTWLDSCVAGIGQYDSIQTETSVTASMALRRLFETPIGFHQATALVGRATTGNYEKTLFQVSQSVLTRAAGLWTTSAMAGENIPGENTLRHRFALEWTGTVAGRIITFDLSEARLAGSVIFGQPREDRITRAGIMVPFGRVDVGGFVARTRSTIDAYRGTEVGVVVQFRANLL